MRYLGLVKWYNGVKGFGVIGTSTEEVFLHHSQLEHKPPEDFQGTALIFEIRNDRGRATAKEITKASDFQDFSFILSHITSAHTVQIEITITGRSRWGNPYRRREVRTYDVVREAILQFFKEQPFPLVIDYFRRYFDDKNLATDQHRTLRFLSIFVSVVHALRSRQDFGEAQDLLDYFLKNLSSGILFQVWKNKLDQIEWVIGPLHTVGARDRQTSFDLPESIFIDNYISITSEEVQRLRFLVDGSRIIKVIISKRLEDHKSLDKQEIAQLVQWVRYIEEEELINSLKKQFCDRFLDLLIELDYSSQEDDIFDTFSFLISKLSILLERSEYDQVIGEFNRTVSEESTYLLWKKTKYFRPDTDFFRRCYLRMLHGDVIKSTEIIELLSDLMNRVEEEEILDLVESILQELLNGDHITLDALKEVFLKADVSQLLQIDLFNYVSSITSSTNRVRLWFEGYSSRINPEDAVDEFLNFSKDQQPRLLRKIFSLIHSGRVSSVEEIIGSLLGLLDHESVNLNVRICLIVIEVMRTRRTYIDENAISEIISSYVHEDLEEIIQISDLFEECQGRTWMTVGKSQESWYVVIGRKEFYVSDDHVLIGDDRYLLDKENRSVLIEGRSYEFKWKKRKYSHLTRTYERPSGVTFCDAVRSDYDENLERHFHWCCNATCFAPCQNDHVHLEWKKYSLRDFLKILDLPFDSDGYYRFVSVINRANRLLHKLQCKSCGRLLRDARTSEFAFYRVTTFHCTNPHCVEYHRTIYLNHCFNWRCNNVVDSRISKRCPNGWLICDSCSNCCSQERIDRRYQNLITNQHFNPNNPRHQKLKLQVENRLGHLEREEVFTYKTGEKKGQNEDDRGQNDGCDLPF